MDDDGPTYRCQNPRCRDTYVPTSHREYQGEYPMGGMVTFIDDDGCPYCHSEGLPEDEDKSEVLFGLIDALEDFAHSMERLANHYGPQLPKEPAGVEAWIRRQIANARDRKEWAITEIEKERS